MIVPPLLLDEVGQSQAPRYCHQCGFQLRSGAKFCPDCGERQGVVIEKKKPLGTEQQEGTRIVVRPGMVSVVRNEQRDVARKLKNFSKKKQIRRTKRSTNSRSISAGDGIDPELLRLAEKMQNDARQRAPAILQRQQLATQSAPSISPVISQNTRSPQCGLKQQKQEQCKDAEETEDLPKWVCVDDWKDDLQRVFDLQKQIKNRIQAMQISGLNRSQSCPDQLMRAQSQLQSHKTVQLGAVAEAASSERRWWQRSLRMLSSLLDRVELELGSMMQKPQFCYIGSGNSGAGSGSDGDDGNDADRPAPAPMPSPSQRLPLDTRQLSSMRKEVQEARAWQAYITHYWQRQQQQHEQHDQGQGRDRGLPQRRRFLQGAEVGQGQAAAVQNSESRSNSKSRSKSRSMGGSEARAKRDASEDGTVHRGQYFVRRRSRKHDHDHGHGRGHGRGARSSRSGEHEHEHEKENEQEKEEEQVVADVALLKQPVNSSSVCGPLATAKAGGKETRGGTAAAAATADVAAAAIITARAAATAAASEAVANASQVDAANIAIAAAIAADKCATAAATAAANSWE